jgi:hypothetical protein
VSRRARRAARALLLLPVLLLGGTLTQDWLRDGADFSLGPLGAQLCSDVPRSYPEVHGEGLVHACRPLAWSEGNFPADVHALAVAALVAGIAAALVVLAAGFRIGMRRPGAPTPGLTNALLALAAVTALAFELRGATALGGHWLRPGWSFVAVLAGCAGAVFARWSATRPTPPPEARVVSG